MWGVCHVAVTLSSVDVDISQEVMEGQAMANGKCCLSESYLSALLVDREDAGPQGLP